MAAGRSLTLLPITIVPVRSFITTFATESPLLTVKFSKIEIKPILLSENLFGTVI